MMISSRIGVSMLVVVNVSDRPDVPGDYKPSTRGMTTVMAATVTWETLRELAGFRSDGACAFSLYLDLDPSTTPTAADAETRMRSLLDRAEKEAVNGDGDKPHDAKVAVRSDLERIRGWWDNEFDRDGARGLAIFASSTDGLWRV